jgi:hypothetical protein
MSNPAYIVNGQPQFYDFFALEDTASTGIVKSGRGFIHSLTVTGGTAGTVTLYDNIEGSGTVIANFSLAGLAHAGLEGSVKAETFLFDTAFQTGLEIETTAVDTPRITISFR